MDRALREFRIRGVKTNIPFLENVVNHPDFQAGTRHHALAGRDPRAVPVRRRAATAPPSCSATSATSSSTAIRTVAGKPAPAAHPHRARAAARCLRAARRAPASCWRELGPEGFAEWTAEQKRLLVTDTTFRDAHQSLLATRVRTYDMLAIANFVAHRLHNLYSLEMWGGATFDVAMRFLHEDPWARLRRLREAIPNICFQMLLRASNAVGYTAYPDNVVRRVRLRSRRRRASTSSASSIRSTGCPT